MHQIGLKNDSRSSNFSFFPKQYGEEHVSDRGPIPAHLLGNMWAQDWSQVFALTEPYPGRESIDVTPQLKNQVRWGPLVVYNYCNKLIVTLPCIFFPTGNMLL